MFTRDMFPQALLRIRILPRGKLAISPFEPHYGGSFVVTSFKTEEGGLPKGGRGALAELFDWNFQSPIGKEVKVEGIAAS